MDTSSKTKQKVNIFDEDIPSLFELDLPPSKPSRFEIQVEIINDDEQFTLNAFHGQSVTVTGRSTIAQLLTSELGDMADHTSYVMAQTVGKINRYETAVQAGRLEKRLQHFNDRLVDDTGRNILEANRIAAIAMYGDIRTPVNKPVSPSKRKGVFRGVKEFFIGEE